MTNIYTIYNFHTGGILHIVPMFKECLESSKHETQNIQQDSRNVWTLMVNACIILYLRRV
jgi:hypothetical protein